MKRITTIAITLALAAGLCACGRAGIFSPDGPSNPPQLELKVYTQSVEPVKSVHAEYYSIANSIPWGTYSELDGRLRTFYLGEFIIGRPWDPIRNPTSSFESKASYTIVGNYLSATRILTEHMPGQEYPKVTFSAESWNMYGKVYSFWLENLSVDSWALVEQAIANGKCRLVHPEKDIPDAVDALRESFAENPGQRMQFFLAETGPSAEAHADD